jgi:hypothetical protein
MTKQDKLLNEQTIRRWAKLADVTVINENFFEDEEEISTDTDNVGEITTAADINEDDDDDEEVELAPEADLEAEMEPEGGEASDAEGVVQAVLAALEPFGVEAVEDGAEEMEAAPEEAPMEPMEEPPLEEPAEEEAAMGDRYNRKDETLDLDVIDDDALTEAVLKRVLQRILSNNEK